METERLNLLNPNKKPKKSYVQECLSKRDGPVIAASDYTRAFTDQIRPYTDKKFYSFGTDGYGRSDTRKNLRKFFEVDKEHIVAFTLSALEKEQPYDLVIMDLTIPGGMGGKEALEEIKKFDPTVSAIVASGSSDAPIMSEFKQYGFKGCVRKPFTILDLSTAIKNIL